MCAIVNNPGGAVQVRLLPFVHECELAGSVFDLIDDGSLYAQSQCHLICIFGVDTHFVKRSGCFRLALHLSDFSEKV